MRTHLEVVGAPSSTSPGIDPESPLSVAGLTVAYQRKPVLWDVSWSAPQGARIAIVGPNGAGKSTFLKAALALIPRLAGDIAVYGRDVSEQRRLLAYMPQRSSVDWDFPTTTLDVVTMGLYGEIGWFRWPGRRHRERALNYLDSVGMADFADRQIGQLSGGQQQRVFVARALAQEASIYVMDEPLAGVDAATERTVADIIAKLAAEGRTVICVHHDLQTVPVYFDHVVLLNARLIAAGPIATAFTAEHLQKAYGGRLAETELPGSAVPARG
jgi:manganese/zinc/iron transport system ATP- binding protein